MTSYYIETFRRHPSYKIWLNIDAFQNNSISWTNEWNSFQGTLFFLKYVWAPASFTIVNSCLEAYVVYTFILLLQASLFVCKKGPCRAFWQVEPFLLMTSFLQIRQNCSKPGCVQGVSAASEHYWKWYYKFIASHILYSHLHHFTCAHNYEDLV